MKRETLRDRLLAACIAAPLGTDTFLSKPSSESSNSLAEDHVRRRAAELGRSAAILEVDVEWASEEVERVWKLERRREVPYRIISMLSDRARELLHHSGYEMVLKVNHEDPGREILRWRFVTLHLPPGILIAAAKEKRLPCPLRVRLLDQSMAPDHPVAHNHVHHAATMSFEEVWASLQLRALLRPTELVRSLRDTRAFCPGLHSGTCLGGRSDEERAQAKKRPEERALHMAQWADLIRQAFLARRVLDLHSHHTGTLAECHNPCCIEGMAILKGFLKGHVFSQRATITPHPWPAERRRLLERERAANAPAIRRRSDRPRNDLMDELVWDEHSLLARAFVYLRPHEKAASPSIDLEYERLFLQYLRVKVAVFRLLVHPPGELGLEKFLDHFLQIKVYAPEADQLRPRKPQEPGLDVRAVEYRVAPDAWLNVITRRDADKATGPLQDEEVESAWLIHFKRKNHDGKRLPRFGPEVRVLDGEARQIVRALRQRPRLLRQLRGIDVCGVEQDQPLWVSAQTLVRLRKDSQEIAGGRPKLGLEPLRLTLHAGEDFKWLTSGLRAIAEPFLWNLIERGDRIGHGIAVTLDPSKWWKRRRGKVISVRRLDRLLDLAFLAEYVAKPSPPQREWLCNEIEEALKGLHLLSLSSHSGRTEGIDLLGEAKNFWRELGGPLTRHLMSSPDWSLAAERPHEEWIYRLLWRRSVQTQADDNVRLKVEEPDSPELSLLLEARKRLIHQLARWQVCIECNPSSNFIVAGFDDMEARAFLQKRPTGQAGFGEETLTWTISTDDPITFSTTLADEYAYTWAGLVFRDGNPYDPTYVRALLDEAAATSMRMRFTIPHDDGSQEKRHAGRRRGDPGRT